MCNEPLMVTIQCLTYNHKPYIRQCLEGFVMQKTNFRFEAIVHDDASTDGTAEIIREYAAKYPNIIKPILETENLYSKHNDSLGKVIRENTYGKYVAMCEGDDYWTDPLKLQKQVEFLENNQEYGLVYTDLNLYIQNKDKFVNRYIQSGLIKRQSSFVEHLKNRGYIAPCTWLYRREYLPTQPLNYVDGTFPLALDIWAHSKIYFLEDVTAVYRKLEESASHSKSLENMFRFSKGVFQIQKDYIVKYSDLVSEHDRNLICLDNYSTLLPAAVAIGENEFIGEAISFFKRERIIAIKPLFILLFRKVLFLKFLFRFLYKRKGIIVKQ